MFDIKESQLIHDEMDSLDIITSNMLQKPMIDQLMKLELETFNACVDSLRSKCFPPKQFVPLHGTVFLNSGSRIPCVVEEHSRSCIAIPHNISRHQCNNATSYYHDWLAAVKDGNVELVWCPRDGRIVSNDVWLKSWGLS